MNVRRIAARVVFAVVLVASAQTPPSVATATGGDLPTIAPLDRLYDHLRCYRIKDPFRFAARAELTPLQRPPFPVEAGCKVRVAAREFCIPAHEEPGPVLSPNGPVVELDGQDLVHDYLCYKIRCPAAKLPNGWPVVDQFGRRVIRDFKPRRICTPARKLPVQQTCCDPRQEPGNGVVPPCVEGATCCNDGAWRCNDGSGQSTCAFAGERCADACGGFAGLPCPEGQFCLLEPGQCCCDFTGRCTVPPDACPAVVDPVCGCDGRTYDNACEAERAGVSVDHVGACDGGDAVTP